MVRPVPLLVSLVTLSATVLAGTSVAADAAGQPPVKTAYALKADGYGTQVIGGSIPAKSDQTAFNVIGCTNRAGIERNNYEAHVTVPGLGVLNGVRTDLWTAKKGSTVSSYATHKIAKIVLGSGALGSVEITGVKSMARAYHEGTSFKAQTTTSIAAITFTPAGGKPQNMTIPTPDKPLTVPGLATIAVGESAKKVTAQGASAAAVVLDIHVLPTDTRVLVAQSRTNIGSGVKHGLFKGSSAGLTASALATNARVGRTPLTVMPCQGTKGKIEGKKLAQVHPSSQLDARGLSTSEVGTNGKTRAFGSERAKVAHASIANGAIQVDGIVAVANVDRNKGRVTSNTKGSRVLSVTANGKSYDMSKLQTITIPGLAKIQARVVKHLKGGVSVTGLEVTLLDGTGAVIDLAVAKLQISQAD